MVPLVGSTQAATAVVNTRALIRHHQHASTLLISSVLSSFSPTPHPLWYPFQLRIFEKLGGGSSGRLYSGSYRGSEVAVKVIQLADDSRGDVPSVYSDSLRNASAAELLQCFKQEVAIMR